MSQANDVMSQQGQYVQANGLKMYYEEYGNGEPLVLIHASLATGAGNWKAYVPYLSPHFRLIMPDLRGHGRTNNPQGEIRLPTLTDDLVAFIKELNLEKPFLCGWSGGGDIALDVGIRYPNSVRAMVVGGVTHRVSEEYFNTMRAMGAEAPGKVNFEQFEKAMPQFVELLRIAHSQSPEHWKTLLTQISNEMLEPTLPSHDDLKKITTPTLIIWGDRDQYLPVEDAIELYRLLPNAELTVLPNTNHSLSVTRIEQFANNAKEFLLRHTASVEQNSQAG
jgi:pimeloyl-ACP methyl ester carboxylesterase